MLLVVEVRARRPWTISGLPRVGWDGQGGASPVAWWPSLGQCEPGTVRGHLGQALGSLASLERATFSTLSSLVSWSIMTWSLLGLGWSPWRPQPASCGPGGSHGHWLPGLGE